MQDFFHLEQTLGLIAGKLDNGDARPHADYLGDVLLGDLRLLLLLLGLPLSLHLLYLFLKLKFPLPEFGGVVILLGGQGRFLVLPGGILALFELFQRDGLGTMPYPHP